MTRCPIVPPYLLEALAASRGHGAADRARRTLELDVAARSRRLAGPTTTPTTTVSRRASTEPPSESSPGPDRRIHDAQQTETLPCDLVRSEGGGDSIDTAVNEAFDGLGHTYAFWSEVFGRDSLDGAGMPLVATVHYGREYDNAFWDGEQMVFGDGDGEIFLGFTRSLDVIGHELAHGVTQFTSNLTYAGQSGALNESVSDVFGVLVKQHSLGQTADQADWLVGADLLAPGVQGKALRSMAEPGTAYDDPRLGTDPQPGHMDGYLETTEDNGGVHLNSGIPNKAFHLVATTLGGHAWERAGQIWWDTVTGEIPTDCDFATFADLTITATTTRYGDGSPEAVAVSEAWSGVGVTVTGPSPTEPGPGEPIHEPIPPGGELVVRRSGGVTGIARERTLVLDDLPPEERSAWQSLLDPGRLAALTTDQPSRPDAFSYAIRCPSRGIDVTVPDSALPTELRRLVERSLRG